MKSKLFVIVSLAMLLCGYLSIVRMPSIEREDFSDDGYCTNRVWGTSMIKQIGENNTDVAGLYPTIKMRWVCTKKMYFEPPEKDMTGEQLYRRRMGKYFGWIPLTIIWLTSPLDGAVDTLMIPFDWE